MLYFQELWEAVLLGLLWWLSIITSQNLALLPYTRAWFCLLTDLSCRVSSELSWCCTTKPRKVLSGVWAAQNKRIHILGRYKITIIISKDFQFKHYWETPICWCLWFLKLLLLFFSNEAANHKVAVGKKQRHTEHSVELHWDQIKATKWTFEVVLFGPSCTIEVWLCAKRIQHTNHTPDSQTQTHTHTSHINSNYKSK